MELKMEVYSPGLELLGELEIQNAVLWERKAFSSGSFSVNSLITEGSRELLKEDHILWIAGEDAGIIEYIQEEAGEDGPYITAKGCDLTGILARRILWGTYALNGPVPALMYQLVDDCCIHPTRGDAKARIIPGLVLSDAPGGGTIIRTQKTGGTLLEALEALGEAYQIPFGVRFDPAVPCMEFWARPGVDRSVRQSTVEPVFYSTELDDVLSSEYSYNSQDYRNVSLVAGEGEGSERVYVTVEGEIQEMPDTPVTPPAPDEPTKYTVTLSVDPAGGGMASGGKTVASGVSITVTATPSDGYEFAGWSENGAIVSTSASYTFTVTGDRTLTAVFAAVIQTFTVTAAIDPAGSGTVSGAGTYQQGASVTVTAEPAENFTFTAWQEGGTTVSEAAVYTFTVSGDRSLTAVFAEKAASRLPEGYTEVAYIVSDEQSGFRTGLNAFSPGSRIVMDVEPEWNGTTDICAFFGSAYKTLSSSGTKVYFYLRRIADGTLRAATYASTHNFGDMLPASGRYTIDFNTVGKYIEVNGVKKTFTPGNYNAYIGGTYLLRPITTYAGGSTSYGMPGKLYSAQVYRDGELYRDFVPCIAPDGAVGLYDLVYETFYGNYFSAGVLTAGPAV